MVTVTLWCGIVGAANGAFSMPIDIDANKSVGALKYEIQHHNSGTITCDASALQLLVDKEDKYKLTEAAVLQGVDARITSGMTCLRLNSATIKQTCLSRVNERAKLSENDVAEGKAPTDVLVVVPQDAASGASAALTKIATEQAIMVGGVPGGKKRKAEATALASLDELVTLAALGRTLDREIDLEVGKTVRVPKQVFDTVFANGLFVRKEYWDLHEMIELELKARGDELVTRVLVTGSPGIGKSVFGVFLLLVFMTERKDVAYLPLKQRSPYYFSWNSTEGHYGISRTPVADKKYEGLFDGEESGDALAFHSFRHAFLFAGPRNENFNHFVNDVCFTVFMSPWTKDECQALADESQLGDQGEWFHRFNLVGGKPRFLFSSFLTYDVLVKRVKGAISRTVNEMEARIGELQRQQFGDGMRHMLFLIYRDVNDPSCFLWPFHL